MQSAFDVWIKGDNAFVACGRQGLNIFDISNPFDIREVGRLGESWGGSWGELLGVARRIFIKEDTAYICNDDAGLWIVNVSNPEDPKPIRSYWGETFNQGLTLNPQDARVVNDTLFLSYALSCIGRPGFAIIDVSDASSPEELSNYDHEPYTSTTYIPEFEVIGNRAYLASSSGLIIMDIGNYSNPKVIREYEKIADSLSALKSIEIVENHAYILASGAGAAILDITDPTDIQIVANGFFSDRSGFSIKIYNDLAYIATSEDGLLIFDVSNPKSPVEVSRYTKASVNPRRMVMVGDFIYMTYESKKEGEKGSLAILRVRKQSAFSSGFIIGVETMTLIAIVFFGKGTIQKRRPS
ncbi:MAG: LVIVD repeat-containing protein [Candidatus Hodarchaeota archaeon]